MHVHRVDVTIVIITGRQVPIDVDDGKRRRVRETRFDGAIRPNQLCRIDWLQKSEWADIALPNRRGDRFAVTVGIPNVTIVSLVVVSIERSPDDPSRRIE